LKLSAYLQGTTPNGAPKIPVGLLEPREIMQFPPQIALQPHLAWLFWMEVQAGRIYPPLARVTLQRAT
jgi:hypothetical protein